MSRHRFRSLTIVSSLLGLSGAFACSDGGVMPAGIGGANSFAGQPGQGGASNVGGTNGVGGVGGITLPGIGAPCSTTNQCRPGLTCNAASTCEPGHTTAIGAACVIAQECVQGSQCVAGLCAPEGTALQGESCNSDAQCKAGLRCGLVGLGAQCLPEGNVDLGGQCARAADCFAGLACLAGTCAPAPTGLPPFVQGLPWTGVECEPPGTGVARAYFEIPGAAGAQEKDFFRLPFPNDARIKNGKLDLTGFPTPGAGFLGFDPVKLYIDAITASETAWGTSPTVTFRFSAELEWTSFQDQTKRAVRFQDITAGADEYGHDLPIQYLYSYGAGTYVCDHSVSVRLPAGVTLLPGHTYAVWFTTDGKSKGNQNIERAENLISVLGSEPPTDPALQAVHAAYKPFRDFLADSTSMVHGVKKTAIDPNTVVNAAVITVSNTRKLMTELAAAVTKETPTAKNWVKCGGAAPSPCPQAEGDRACGPENADYDEYHALVSLPVFQTGTAPYLSEGGAIDLNSSAREDMCLALTVPKAAMPADGYPLVVHAHGTGGSFRSHIRPEVSGALAKATPPTAVLGIDQVAHGPRRGASNESPNNLFFNFTNPAASRGNPLQGAADQLGLLKFAASLNLTAEQSGGTAFKIDGAKVSFFGHSQGATHGSLMLPFAETTSSAVLSGNGAMLIESLLSKTNPVNIAAALPIALQDPHWFTGLNAGLYHPVMSLLQQWIDPADPVNFAPLLKAPLNEGKPKNVFQTYGHGDTYSPPATLRAFIFSGALEQVAPDGSVTTPDPAFTGYYAPKAAPLASNVTVGAEKATQGFRQYAPPTGRDGHFVVFDVASANQDVVRFLTSAPPPPIAE